MSDTSPAPRGAQRGAEGIDEVWVALRETYGYFNDYPDWAVGEIDWEDPDRAWFLTRDACVAECERRAAAERDRLAEGYARHRAEVEAMNEDFRTRYERLRREHDALVAAGLRSADFATPVPIPPVPETYEQWVRKLSYQVRWTPTRFPRSEADW